MSHLIPGQPIPGAHEHQPTRCLHFHCSSLGWQVRTGQWSCTNDNVFQREAGQRNHLPHLAPWAKPSPSITESDGVTNGGEDLVRISAILRPFLHHRLQVPVKTRKMVMVWSKGRPPSHTNQVTTGATQTRSPASA